MESEGFPVWVVCKGPADYPGKFTARKHIVTATADYPSNEVYVADKISWLRLFLRSQGLTRTEPHPDDSPIIYEIWL